MPHIKAFKALLPNSHFANKVAVYVEHLNLQDAKGIRALNAKSFLHLLVPKIDSYFLQGSKQELAFKKIAENLEDFLANEILIQDKEPAVYIYQIKTKHYEQTGVWALTCVKDYQQNIVKKHELTRADREKDLSNYILQTGIDANPVLITYESREEIKTIISKVKSTLPELIFELDYTEHAIWKITDPDKIKDLETSFENLPSAYIADGHHRAAAACTVAELRKKANPDHTGLEEYNFFNSLYISSDQLNIFEFNRLVKQTNISEKNLITTLKEDFDVREIKSNDIKPKQKGEFGLFFNNKAYTLTLKNLSSIDNKFMLDAAIIQDLVLGPLFNITNPKTDKNISFFPGNIPKEKLLDLINKGEYTAAVFLFPTPVKDIMRSADAGEIMPPKSTWFEPKLPIGLLTHFVM